jgi:hypothetical protein
MTWLRTPEELLELGLALSPVVMVNEAHDGLRRCVRTRLVGRRLLPIAHRLGVRHLAMEALWNRDLTGQANEERRLPKASGYLAQPEMRALIQDALDLGWTLIAYEADMTAAPSPNLMSKKVSNWREREQARKLAAALPDAPLLVWCGWGHLSKTRGRTWSPMGYRFKRLTGIEPFALDQTTTVGSEQTPTERWVERLRSELESLGGTAGFLTEDAPPGWRQCWADAFLLSLDNELV